jgi:hypothetical protein
MHHWCVCVCVRVCVCLFFCEWHVVACGMWCESHSSSQAGPAVYAACEVGKRGSAHIGGLSSTLSLSGGSMTGSMRGPFLMNNHFLTGGAVFPERV